MSNPEKKTGPEKRQESLSDHLRKSMSFDKQERDKPDFKETDLSSPCSPLRSGGSGLTATTATTTTTTTTSSSSSSSGSVSGRMGHQVPVNKKSDSHHSAESSPTGGRGGGGTGGSKPSHRRSHSGGSQSSYSFSSGVGGGGASVTSPQAPVHLPAGNICPLGGQLKTGMASPPVKTDIVGSGRGQYGHGSIMRAGTSKYHGKTSAPTPTGPPTNLRGSGAGARSGSGLSSSGSGDPEELKKLGNEYYQKGNYSEALKLYDRAIAISPNYAPYHHNRAAALIGLNRLREAVRGCEEAVRLDPNYLRAHHRLGSLLLSFGQVENARKHLRWPGQATDSQEYLKLQAVEKHLINCTNARKANDWNATLKEAEAAMAAGADRCPQLLACQAEALLKMHQLLDPDSYLTRISKLQTLDSTNSQLKFFGIHSEAYLFLVRAKIELAIGKFEEAVTAAEQANQVDARNVEVSVLLGNVKAVSKARTRGNDLYKSERYTEASSAYEEGIKRDPSNPVLYCNRAGCFQKLGKHERALEDCNEALRYHPNHQKALYRRAFSYCKLERWAEAVKDYEVLRRYLPNDNSIAESLFQAQVAWKKSRGEDVSNLKFGGEVELVSDMRVFRAEISTHEASIVHFLSSSNKECQQISPVLDKLCAKYPCTNFLKVDVEKNPEIAEAENVSIVPTIKMYKKGSLVKEIVCPSPEVLESAVKPYSI